MRETVIISAVRTATGKFLGGLKDHKATELGAIAAGASGSKRTALATYGMSIGIAFQHADDRDDAELTEHAAAAAQRMRMHCDEARQAVQALGSTLLDSLASWIAARA